MLHALFLLGFMLVAAPLAGYIPLAALAGVLTVVAWNMIEKPAIAVLLRSGWGEATVLAATFLLTIFRDLTEAIVVGFALGSVLFIQRMSQATAVAEERPFVGRDMPDDVAPRGRYDEARAADPEVVIYRVTGALFFGATASIGGVLDRISDTHRTLVIDLSAVSFLDSTGANMIEGLARKARRRGVALWIAGATRPIRRILLTHDLATNFGVGAASRGACVRAAAGTGEGVLDGRGVAAERRAQAVGEQDAADRAGRPGDPPVSYTHLTLPTN